MVPHNIVTLCLLFRPILYEIGITYCTVFVNTFTGSHFPLYWNKRWGIELLKNPTKYFTAIRLSKTFVIWSQILTYNSKSKYLCSVQIRMDNICIGVFFSELYRCLGDLVAHHWRITPFYVADLPECRYLLWR